MKKNIHKFNITCIGIFLVTILFVSTFGLTTSRYTEQAQATGENVIAVPVLNLTNNSSTYNTTNMLPR